MYFFGVHETATEREYVQTMMVQDLTAKITTGEFSVPGHEKMQAEVSDDLLEPLPPKPSMNKLVVATASDDASKLQLPVAVVKDSRPRVDSALLVGANVSCSVLPDPLVLSCVAGVLSCGGSGMVWYGMVWWGMMWCGVARCGVVWCGMVCRSLITARVQYLSL